MSDDKTVFEQQAETQAHEFTAEAEGMLVVAQAYEIDSPDMYQLAAQELSKIKARYKAINDARLSITRPMDEAKKRVMAFFDQPLKPLKAAESFLKKVMLDWDQKQERIRQEKEAEARKAQEEARKKAEAEAEAARKKAEEAAKGNDEQAAAEARAKAEEAQAQQEALEHAPAPVVMPDTPKVKGLSKRQKWSAEVTDFEALVKAVAEGKAPITLLKVDQTALNGMARSLKDALNIPGIRAVAENVLASR